MSVGGPGTPRPDRVDTFDDLRVELQRLRIRAARGRGKPQLSLQDIAAASGVPKSSVANYLSGATVIPADQLDAVVQGMGASLAETAGWAAAWERAMEHRRGLSGSPQMPPTRRRPRRRRELVAALAAGVVAVAAFGVTRCARDPAPQPRPVATIATRPQCRPVTGDWDGDRRTGVGVACWRENGMPWTISNALADGGGESTGGYGNYDGCLPVTGDWDGDRRTTVAVACGGPASAPTMRWSLINAYAGSPSYPRFLFGESTTCRPVTGDWDGNGTTTAGLACADGGRMRWHLINGHHGGEPSYPPFVFGDARACWPVTGDWDGDGRTSVGTACPADGQMRWHLSNAFGDASVTLDHPADRRCLPVTGDWDGDGTTTTGVACPGGGTLTWTLRDSHTPDGPVHPRFRLGSDGRYVTDQGWPGPGWPVV